MQQDLIKYFSCPRVLDKKKCHGGLVLDRAISYYRYHRPQIKEGYLRCERCGADFPIVYGIAVVVSDLPAYLRNNINIIIELSKKYAALDRNLLADLLVLIKGPKKDIQYGLCTQPRAYYSGKVERMIESHYISSHYDNLGEIADRGEPLYGFLKKYLKKSPHMALDNFLRANIKNKGGLALEVGCNVGGFLPHLARHARYTFGLDSSFEALFLASCFLKGLPKKIDSYRLKEEAHNSKSRLLSIEGVKDLTLVAAEADNLPFRDSCFSIVSSANLLDVVTNPHGLLREKKRILKDGGFLLSSDPYQFLDGKVEKIMLKEGQSPKNRIKEMLGPKMKIVGELDMVPWITRSYRRSYSIYYNHSFCAQKRIKKRGER